MRGLFLIDRSMLTHHIVGIHNPERFAAWCWMLSQARWRDGFFDVSGRTVAVCRGQFVTTLPRMATETGLSVKQVRTFFARLEREGMCQKTGIGSGRGSGIGASLITICNYEEYQDFKKYRAEARAEVGADQGQAKGRPRADKRTPDETPDETPDNTTHPNGCDTGKPASRFWDDCISVLMEGGVTSDRAARSLLGKWTKVAGRDKVAEIVTQARASPDMVAFIEAAMAEKGETTMEKAERLRKQRAENGYDIKGHW